MNKNEKGENTLDTANQIIDIMGLYERVAGDEELLQEIIELFLEDVDGYLDNIKRAIEDKDPNELQKNALTLKGAVDTFAAEPAKQAAFQLEKIGRKGKIEDGTMSYYNELKTQIDLLVAKLKEMSTAEQS